MDGSVISIINVCLKTVMEVMMEEVKGVFAKVMLNSKVVVLMETVIKTQHADQPLYGLTLPHAFLVVMLGLLVMMTMIVKQPIFVFKHLIQVKESVQRNIQHQLGLSFIGIIYYIQLLIKHQFFIMVSIVKVGMLKRI